MELSHRTEVWRAPEAEPFLWKTQVPALTHAPCRAKAVLSALCTVADSCSGVESGPTAFAGQSSPSHDHNAPQPLCTVISIPEGLMALASSWDGGQLLGNCLGNPQPPVPTTSCLDPGGHLCASPSPAPPTCPWPSWGLDGLSWEVTGSFQDQTWGSWPCPGHTCQPVFDPRFHATSDTLEFQTPCVLTPLLNC